jgi:hypothetical protein
MARYIPHVPMAHRLPSLPQAVLPAVLTGASAAAGSREAQNSDHLASGG